MNLLKKKIMNNKIIDYGKRYDRVFRIYAPNLSYLKEKELTNWQIAGIVFIIFLVLAIAGNGDL